MKVAKVMAKLLIFTMLTGFGWTVLSLADDNAKPVPSPPTPVAISDPEIRREITEALTALTIAQKDLNIAMLRAKVKYGVGEDWQIDWQGMRFVPPPPKLVRPDQTPSAPLQAPIKDKEPSKP